MLDTNQIIYLGALAGILVGASLMRSWLIAWTAALLLLNWAINTWIASASGTQFNWIAMGWVDFLTAALLLSGVRITRWQIVVACIFAFMLIAHAARAWVGPSSWSDYYYWHALSKAAWAQVWVMVGWCCHDGLRRIWRALDPYRRARFVAALPARLGTRIGEAD